MFQTSSTRAAQKVLHDLLHFSQNQQEMSAVFFSTVNSECPACYSSAAGRFLGRAQGVLMLAWYGVYILSNRLLSNSLWHRKNQ
jgi:hypothetical protein